MGLLKTVECSNGLTIENAYHRVELVSGDKTKINFQIVAYINKNAQQEGKTSITTRIFEFTPGVSDDSFNFIKQAYEYLKTLPDFIGAVDA